MKVLSIRDALAYGFKTAGRHFLFFAGSLFLLGLLNVAGICAFLGINWPTFMFFMRRIPEACNFFFTDAVPSGQEFNVCLSSILDQLSSHWILYSVLFILGCAVLFCIACYIILGWINALLHVYDYHVGSFRSLFVHPRLLVPFIGAGFLYVLMVAAGSLALIIPGILLAIKFGMFGCVIVDKNAGLLESLRMSSAITYGAKWHLFLLGAVLGLLGLLSGAIEGLANVAILLSPLLSLVLVIAGKGISLVLYVVASLVGIYAYRTLNAQTYAPATR